MGCSTALALEGLAQHDPRTVDQRVGIMVPVSPQPESGSFFCFFLLTKSAYHSTQGCKRTLVNNFFST